MCYLIKNFIRQKFITGREKNDRLPRRSLAIARLVYYLKGWARFASPFYYCINAEDKPRYRSVLSIVIQTELWWFKEKNKLHLYLSLLFYHHTTRSSLVKGFALLRSSGKMTYINLLCQEISCRPAKKDVYKLLAFFPPFAPAPSG
jgi:hypothetical protein